ncbi:MAG: hypothetical protein US25_C0042G0009 [Candidatus Moranbacteria bacterium GW2011_GWE1_36_7]|nr:MAG: hypothetical protein UR99_C0055G0009 [Candidatus Moranbacteria bacterium GW2011_GWD2_36_12]KKQ13140.1 MAG: hypothetical protein US25_C0042G0009 [Candidatus Moranbacteria bacterium GW2011_GWE1_36_7]
MLTKKDSEEKIKITLKDYGLSEEQMKKTIDTLYQLADVFFDVWLESKSNKKI